MNNPLVSVIVPVYGVEKYIERCARSIFEQTYKNLEIIFVDDCSPDRSVKILQRILEEYPNRQNQTDIMRHKKNLGSAGARITGQHNATGKYSIHTDSDDYIESCMIQEMVEKAESENADITICDFLYHFSNNEEHKLVNPSLNHIECMCQVMKGIVHSSLCNKLVRRNLYTDNNIAFTAALNMFEDLSVMYRLLFFANKIAYIPKPFYHYDLTRSDSMTSTKMNQSHQEDLIALNRQMLAFQKKHNLFDNNSSVTAAFQHMRAGSLSSIALYGDFHQIRRCPDIFCNVKVTDIYKSGFAKPKKLAGILYLLHCTPLLHLLRFMQQFKHKMRKNAAK